MSTDLDPDVALMLRLQAGDESALATLFQRHAHRVLNLAYRYLGDRARAEDVVQESFLKLYASRARYRPEAKFQSYLLRIASNLCISMLRKKRPASLTGPDDAPTEPPDPDAPDADARLLHAEMKARVRAAVDQLPERQRLAIVLNKFEGLDYAGVAEHLGLSVPATKSLLHRARMALKEVLEP